MELVRPAAGAALRLAHQPISLNFALRARVRGPISREGLENALACLARRHPLLGMRASQHKDGIAVFTDEGVPPVPLRVAERGDGEAWVGEVETDIQQRTDYLRGPLVRCIWLRGVDISDIILVCDHLAADGRAAIFALRDLLTFLAEPQSPTRPLVPPPIADLVPPEIVKWLRSMPPEQLDEMNRLRSGGPDSGSAGSAGSPAGGEWPRESTGPVRIRPFELDAAQTAALVARCHVERVTVQAALCAAFLRPFAERQPERPVRRAEVPVDLRPRLASPVGDVYENMISLAMLDIDCAPEQGLWGCAREAAAAIAGIRDRDLFSMPLLVFAITGRPLTRPIPIGYDLSISNLGRLDIPTEYGALRLESIYAPMFPAARPGHRILGVSTFAGQMRCTFSSCDPDSAGFAARGRELLAAMLQ